MALDLTIFDLLRSFKNYDEIKINIDKGVKQDIAWFRRWLKEYINRVSVIRTFTEPQHFIVVDACLVGARGYCPGIEQYSYEFTAENKDRIIA